MSLEINQKHYGVGDNIGGDKVVGVKPKKSWFSMDNPIVWILASLFLFILTYFVIKLI